MRLPAIALFFLALLASPGAVFAHQVLQDKNISILLHMEPGDDPAAREEALLYFYLKDSDKKFDKSDCDCEVRIERSGAELLRVRLGPEYIPENFGDNVWEIPFIFPERDVYQVIMSGKARGGEFADFSLKYDVRIEREGVPQADSSLGITPIVIGVIIIGIVAFFIMKKKLI